MNAQGFPGYQGFQVRVGVEPRRGVGGVVGSWGVLFAISRVVDLDGFGVAAWFRILTYRYVGTEPGGMLGKGRVYGMVFVVLCFVGSMNDCCAIGISEICGFPR